ncbi:MAG: DJ-1/PfpI family protein [Hafnia sp.]|jgi:putative intracellular protease/amidase|uniref:Intracellular protease/amidase n=1 Tax=Obesumbacterium proteus ATCC 12841 TaxID=1354268 RepID=A0AA91EIA4_9GAMM|nr:MULTISPECIES: DJ-1/PfpI family protein [Hafniaceae]MDN5449960.1 DJ-1/PfpI family protein [Enterobacterales bacterium]MDN5987560.1 DJ-1/PfpI family protein [Hafniaceae bacterium]NEY29649.1 DJ-1/PfpI family protein [Escherichia coli]AMO80276.1 thiamine biosynthesis protein ThiJ [Obesumbacterium proteus]MDN5970301.1 DJ-1/PfpI family protein [Enterobacterales bacterium]
MSKKVAVLLAKGFEEAEAIMTIDVLRRLDIHVTTLACQDMLELTSYHNIRMFADVLLERSMDETFDAVVIPGGPEGTVNLAANPLVVEFIRRHDAAGKWICPICSAAARVLGGNNLLNGRRYTCSGDLHQDVKDGIYVDEKIVEDGNLLSGKGLGVAFDFAFHLGWKLTGDASNVDFQVDHIYYDYWRTNA